MTKPRTKALTTGPNPPAKTPGFAVLDEPSGSRSADSDRQRRPTKHKKSSPIPARLRRAVTRLARELRNEYGWQGRPTADRLARLFRASITPRRKPGRRPTEAVLRAAQLREKGTPWPKVYEQVIPNYQSLWYEQQLYCANKLRDAGSIGRGTETGNQPREQ